jgi:small ligand-binding sensory domain FIST
VSVELSNQQVQSSVKQFCCKEAYQVVHSRLGAGSSVGIVLLRSRMFVESTVDIMEHRVESFQTYYYVLLPDRKMRHDDFYNNTILVPLKVGS